MANTQIFLVQPIPKALASGANSFVTSWGDKRSSTTASISLVFYGANAPDGVAWVETSAAPEQAGSTSLPNNQGDDAAEVPSSQQTITLNSVTGLYGCQWAISGCPAHWIRVRYTANTSVAGLTVNCYLNAPHESP